MRDQTASIVEAPARTTIIQVKQRSLNIVQSSALSAKEVEFARNATGPEETMQAVYWQHGAVPFVTKQGSAINAGEQANSRSTKRVVC